jgi:hypothetical protein
MPKHDVARPRVTAPARTCQSSWLVEDRHFTVDPEGCQQVRHVHELDVCPFGHLFDEIKRDPTNRRQIIRRYADLSPRFVEAFGGQGWTESRDLMRRFGP